MVKAWKLPDGRYRLDFGDSPFVLLTYPSQGGDMAHMGGVWNGEYCQWIVPESAIDRLNADGPLVEVVEVTEFVGRTGEITC